MEKVPYIETKKLPKNPEICGLISNVLFSSKYLDLYRKQNDVSKKLGEWAKNNEKYWGIPYFSPEYLTFDGDMVIYNDFIEEPHLFEIKDGKINEISLVPENLSKCVMCKDIKMITSGVYYVVLDRCNDYDTTDFEHGKFKGCSYFINRYGEKILDGQESLYQEEINSESEKKKIGKDEENAETINQNIKFGKRLKDITSCEMIFDEERGTVSIINTDGKILYTVDNFSEYNKNQYYPVFLSDKRHTIINYRHRDSNILFVKEIINPSKRKQCHSKIILINKKTGESREYDGESLNVILHGNLVEVFNNSNSSKIYDENFNELGDTIRATGDLNFFAVKKHENGDEKCYLCLAETGKILCEIGDKKEYHVIKRKYFDENKNRHTIIETVNGTLIDVVSKTKN